MPTDLAAAARGPDPTQFQFSTLAGQSAPWVMPVVEAEAAARGIAPSVLIERAERRFQAVYTVCLALVSGPGYTLVYRLLYRRALRDWRSAFKLALNYLAFLFVLFLPWLVITAILRRWIGDAAIVGVFLLGIVVAVAWNTAAARRLGGHGRAMALAKGVAVMLAGFVIDTAMSALAVVITLRTA